MPWGSGAGQGRSINHTLAGRARVSAWPPHNVLRLIEGANVARAEGEEEELGG